VDEQDGDVSCLAEAPDADLAVADHRKAQGLIADQVFGVVGTTEMGTGRTQSLVTGGRQREDEIVAPALEATGIGLLLSAGQVPAGDGRLGSDRAAAVTSRRRTRRATRGCSSAGGGSTSVLTAKKVSATSGSCSATRSSRPT
jgi:hypothetical protein